MTQTNSSELLSKSCPVCRQENSVIIEKNHIRCTHSGCSFHTRYCCPLCDHSLENASFSEDTYGTFFKCPGCQNAVHTRRVAYMIENGLVMDYTTLCSYCNGPTVHRHEMNLGNRCFFFPRCSGQADLFGGSRESLVFLDFETTGLEPGRDHIIEIGALKIDEEGYEHTFQKFIKPPISISSRITQITGITDEMVKDAKSIEGVIGEFVSFIGSAKIVAHNAEFDLPWLMVALKRNNLRLSGNEVICTLNWARESKEGSASLEALTRKYKIGHQNAHRALADAAATKELFFIYENAKKAPRFIMSLSKFEETADKFLAQYAVV